MSTTYQDYKNARNAVWDILIQYKIDSLPISLTQLCAQMGIELVSFKTAKSFLKAKGLWKHTYLNDGFTCVINQKTFTFYNDSVISKGRVRFTIAHELGHIVLGHLDSNSAACRSSISLWNRGEKKEPNPYESMANIFASRLLAPACVLHELQILSENEIAEKCGLSRLAAHYRAERMAELEARNKFYLDKREIIVAKNFGVYKKLNVKT